jgi:hypothetical protein
VVLVGIGPNRLRFIDERLRVIEGRMGLNIRSLFHRTYMDDAGLEAEHNVGDNPPYELHHHDLHSRKVVDYQAEVPYSYAGVEFHPTYEGKVMTWLAQRPHPVPEFWSGSGMLWIVGGPPRAAAMLRHLRKVGDQPSEMRLWGDA